MLDYKVQYKKETKRYKSILKSKKSNLLLTKIKNHINLTNDNQLKSNLNNTNTNSNSLFRSKKQKFLFNKDYSNHINSLNPNIRDNIFHIKNYIHSKSNHKEITIYLTFSSDNQSQSMNTNKNCLVNESISLSKMNIKQGIDINKYEEHSHFHTTYNSNTNTSKYSYNNQTGVAFPTIKSYYNQGNTSFNQYNHIKNHVNSMNFLTARVCLSSQSQSHVNLRHVHDLKSNRTNNNDNNNENNLLGNTNYKRFFLPKNESFYVWRKKNN